MTESSAQLNMKIGVPSGTFEKRLLMISAPGYSVKADRVDVLRRDLLVLLSSGSTRSSLSWLVLELGDDSRPALSSKGIRSSWPSLPARWCQLVRGPTGASCSVFCTTEASSVRVALDQPVEAAGYSARRRASGRRAH